MGIEINLMSPLKPVGLFRLRPQPAKVLADVEQAFRAAVADQLLREMMTVNRVNDSMIIRLHPAGEVEFNFENDRLICYSKTTTVGPGYHACIVEILEHVERKCGLAWSWDDPDGGDGAGYHQSHDFAQLQLVMLDWLHNLAVEVVKLPSDVMQIQLSLPVDFRPCSEYFAISTLGEWTRAWFEQVAASGVEALILSGVAFFPWWEQETTASFWRNYGLSLCWVELPWHPPYTDEEQELYRQAIHSIQRAGELDPRLELPQREIAEIRALLKGDPANPQPPASDGIGFRRRPMCMQLAGGWTVEVPGYYYCGVEDDGNIAVFGFGGRAVRISTMSYTMKAGVPPMLPIDPDDAPEENLGITELHKDGIRGWSTIVPQQDEGETYFTLHGKAIVPNHLCIATITFERIDEREWAEQVWQTISFTPEVQEQG